MFLGEPGHRENALGCGGEDSFVTTSPNAEQNADDAADYWSTLVILCGRREGISIDER